MDIIKKLEGLKTQIALALTLAFELFNSFWPDVFTAEQETKILKLLLVLAGIFYAMKVQRGANK